MFEYVEKNSEQIAREIRDKIVSLELLPGTMISENELSERYLVSRTKIRAALSELKSDRYVVVIAQKGTFVSYIDKELVDDIVTLRTSAELRVLSELASDISDEGLNELRSQLDKQRVCMNMGMSYAEFEKYDILFHETCYRLAGRENMWQILSSYAPHYKRFRDLDPSKAPQVRLAFMEHCGIYEGLRLKSKEKAGAAAYKHISDDYAKYKVGIAEKFPAYFS